MAGYVAWELGLPSWLGSLVSCPCLGAFRISSVSALRLWTGGWRMGLNEGGSCLLCCRLRRGSGRAPGRFWTSRFGRFRIPRPLACAIGSPARVSLRAYLLFSLPDVQSSRLGSAEAPPLACAIGSPARVSVRAPFSLSAMSSRAGSALRRHPCASF